MIGDLSALHKRLATWRNRGHSHLFLGHPQSDACDKTTVEAGGSFSPGVWTCGITVWIDSGAGWTCAEDLPLEAVSLVFIEAPGAAPVAVSRWRSGALAVEHRIAQLGAAGHAACDVVEVVLRSPTPATIALAVTLGGHGPAGGIVSGLAWDGEAQAISCAQGTRLELEPQATPAQGAIADNRAAAAWTLAVTPAVPLRLAFRARHGFATRAFADIWQPPPVPVLPVATALAHIAADWTTALPGRIHAPDPRVALTWERAAYHLMAAMECGLPRIGAVNYPVLWLRDGVIVLRALDCIGRADLARIGCDDTAGKVFAGGFGAEADAPGEGIWVLLRHAEMSGDLSWLDRQFDGIAERVEWIRRMRTATAPIRVIGENRLPAYVNAAACGLLCLPATDGLVHGRMDWHCPDFFINCWSQAGLAAAARAAALLGRDDEARAWAAEAADLDERIARVLLPSYGNERDPACLPHPTGALVGHHAALLGHFTAWFAKHRLDALGRRAPEPLWTYFEAAQAHNALLLGLRNEAWVVLNGLCAADGPRDASLFVEGPAGGNEHLPFRNDVGARGWLDPVTAQAGNMPHNWTGAEMLLALRDVYVRDDGPGVVIGSGVPAAWLQPGASFGCTGLPTRYGRVLWQARVRSDRSLDLAYDGPACTTDFPRI